MTKATGAFMIVFLVFSIAAVTFAQTSPATVTGVVRAVKVVDAKAGIYTVTVTPTEVVVDKKTKSPKVLPAGPDIVLDCNEKTSIKKDNVKKSFTDLTAGDNVTITYLKSKNKNTAYEIKVLKDLPITH